MNLAGVFMSGGVSLLSAGTPAEKEGSDAILTRSIDNALDRDAFLKLLTTQLRYQDPMSPVDDQDFLAQMAQFSALEQMQNMSRSLENFLEAEERNSELAQATMLLGRMVEVEGASQATYAGRVEAVRMVDGLPRLVIDGTLFRVKDVVKIVDGPGAGA